MAGAPVTERRLRDLYTWIAAHRLMLIEYAGMLAEAAGWDRRCEGVLERLQERIATIARELALALETLDRIHPPPMDPYEDEDTIPICLRGVLK